MAELSGLVTALIIITLFILGYLLLYYIYNSCLNSSLPDWACFFITLSLK